MTRANGDWIEAMRSQTRPGLIRTNAFLSIRTVIDDLRNRLEREFRKHLKGTVIDDFMKFLDALKTKQPKDRTQSITVRLRAIGSQLRSYWLRIQAYVLVSVTAILGNVAAGFLKDYIDPGTRGEMNGASVTWLFVTCGSFVFFVGLIYLNRRSLFHPQTRFLRTETQKELPPREHLLVFLSDLDGTLTKFEDVLPKKKGVTLQFDWQTDLDALRDYKTSHPGDRSHWRWEQPLRGIWHHLKDRRPLRSITLVCSAKSIVQAHWFGMLVRKYPSNNVGLWVLCKRGNGWDRVHCPVGDEPILTQTQGLDFERFDELSGALQWYVAELTRFRLRHKPIAERQIMIDFTGGQKVTSVVAASVTFNRRVKAQYVQTNQPWEVIGYDMLLTDGLTDGLGW
jgi:hypothetical protein